MVQGRPHRHDIQDVTVHADGIVDVTLVTWGSTLLHLEDVTCHPDGFVTAIKREGNGVSLVTLLLRKEIMRPGSDGFRDWP